MTEIDDEIVIILATLKDEDRILFQSYIWAEETMDHISSVRGISKQAISRKFNHLFIKKIYSNPVILEASRNAFSETNEIFVDCSKISEKNAILFAYIAKHVYKYKIVNSILVHNSRETFRSKRYLDARIKEAGLPMQLGKYGRYGKISKEMFAYLAMPSEWIVDTRKTELLGNAKKSFYQNLKLFRSEEAMGVWILFETYSKADRGYLVKEGISSFLSLQEDIKKKIKNKSKEIKGLRFAAMSKINSKTIYGVMGTKDESRLTPKSMSSIIGGII